MYFLNGDDLMIDKYLNESVSVLEILMIYFLIYVLFFLGIDFWKKRFMIDCLCDIFFIKINFIKIESI